MMVEGCGALVEAACVPRVAKPELLIVEVVAELMAQSAQKRSEGRDLLAHRCPHPDADQHRVGSVVPEKLGGPITLVDARGRAARTRMPGLGTL